MNENLSSLSPGRVYELGAQRKVFVQIGLLTAAGMRSAPVHRVHDRKARCTGGHGPRASVHLSTTGMSRYVSRSDLAYENAPTLTM